MTAADGAAALAADTGDVLRVEELVCEIPTAAGGVVCPVDHVSFSLGHAKTLGIVGESGAGKSMLAKSLMGIAPRIARISGDVYLNSVNIARLPKKQHREMLGAGIAMIFQDPMTSLNPVVPIGRQITESMKFHSSLHRNERRERAIDLLTQVGISEPARRFKQYPHELSGGMRQRVTIAAALACEPKVLIADEATTALDVTVQKQILDLLQAIQQERQMGLIIITHDLGIVAGRTDDIAVMYAGQIVEEGPTKLLFKQYRNRYTAELLRSMPQLDDEVHVKLPTIAGNPPRLGAMPPGCRFAPRCPSASTECSEADPALVGDVPGHFYKCIWPVSDEDRSRPRSEPESLEATR